MLWQNSAEYGSRVRTCTQGRTWVAQERHEGKSVTLGCQHTSELEAAKAISKCALSQLKSKPRLDLNAVLKIKYIILHHSAMFKAQVSGRDQF